jgi:hypothetical protein
MQETHSAKGNALFAVMQLTGSKSPVCASLGALHTTQSVYSYGISDAPAGIFCIRPNGPLAFRSPASQAKSLCHRHSTKCQAPRGTRFTNTVVYCGSSNLTSGGGAANGDNLLAIYDADVAPAFAIEALGLIDHYNFLDRIMNPKRGVPKRKKATAAGAKEARTKWKAAGAKSR